MDFNGSLVKLFVLNIITKDDYINNKVKCLLVTKMEIHASNITENSMEWTQRKKVLQLKAIRLCLIILIMCYNLF